MHRAAVGYLQQPGALALIEIPRQTDRSTEHIHTSVLLITVLTVPGMVAGVLKQDIDGFQRPVLVVGIHAYGHGRTGAKRSQQVFIRIRSEIVTANPLGFICQPAVIVAGDFPQKFVLLR